MKIILSLILTLTTLVAIAQTGRKPSVEPVVEVDIENPQVVEKNTGYNFTVAPVATTKARQPANIVSKKDPSAQPYTGLFIFLFALPIALWIVISKKMSHNKDEKHVDYYPKNQQFKPYRTDYQSPHDDDDIDYPKAS